MKPLAIIGLILGLALIWLIQRNNSQRTEEKNAIERGAGVAPPAPGRAPQPDVGEGPATKSVSESAPTQATVREQARENPHQTPPALIEFARSLAPRMELALQDADQARVLLAELRDCAQNEKIASSARALCTKNAERLQ